MPVTRFSSRRPAPTTAPTLRYRLWVKRGQAEAADQRAQRLGLQCDLRTPTAALRLRDGVPPLPESFADQDVVLLTLTCTEHEAKQVFNGEVEAN